jgi:methyltransferase (TIGR00027 family)
MDQLRPSATALRVARLRARHQISEFASVFTDPYAVRLLGEGEPVPADFRSEDEYTRRLRMFLAARSRFAEDSLAAAAARGIPQAVVLGAGLDTLSLRNPHAAAGLRIFEVDHPATQAWKRERLAAAGIDAPEWVTFVPVDFERQALAQELQGAGYAVDEAAFFAWLGVVPYLTADAISGTLRFIAGNVGSEVVFDYSEPHERREGRTRQVHEENAARVASYGEPWISFFDPDDLARKMTAFGFDELEDLSGTEIAIRYFGAPPGFRSNSGAHLMRARRTG